MNYKEYRDFEKKTILELVHDPSSHKFGKMDVGIFEIAGGMSQLGRVM